MACKRGGKNRLVAKLVGDGDYGPCAFCHRTVDDEIGYGKLYFIGDIYCHYFCVLLSCCLIQKGEDEEGLLGFLYTDIQAEVERSKKHKCSYCGTGGATLGCTVTQCRKQFHLPCGRERRALSLFYGNYKSYCEKHAPRQQVPASIMVSVRERLAAGRRRDRARRSGHETLTLDTADDANECVCVICYESVEGAPSAGTFWPPCCARDAWFHRACLERMALSAGAHYLKCPLCNDKETFQRALTQQGYYMPDRDASWELENSFSDIYSRAVTCTADTCQCPHGRDHDVETGEWDIQLCLLCGGAGSHAACLPAGARRYVCVTCRPAASPRRLDALEGKIAQLLREEETAAARAHPPRLLMPSRMSIRRTKPGATTTRYRCVTASNSPAILTNRGGLTDISERGETVVETSNTMLSRSDLNLKTPRKLQRHNIIDVNILAGVENELLSPIKQLEEQLYSRLGSQPRVVIGAGRVDSQKIVDRLRSKFKKPRPLCAKKKIINAILNEILSDDVTARSLVTSSSEMLSPAVSPERNRGLEVTASESGENSENILALKAIESTNEAKLNTPIKIKNETQNKTKTPETKRGETPTTPKATDKIDTDKIATDKLATDKLTTDKITTNKIDTDKITTDKIDTDKIATDKLATDKLTTDKITTNKIDTDKITTDKIDTDKIATDKLTTHKITTIKIDTDKITTDKIATDKLATDKLTTDKIATEQIATEFESSIAVEDSSNSTFQLPPEFIAESDDSLPIFDTPVKCKTVDIKTNSSLEISERDESVNIDVVNNDVNETTSVISTEVLNNLLVLSPLKLRSKVAFIPCNKEADYKSIGIDLEDFKNQYLNELERKHACAFNHKHKNQEIRDAKIKSAIDFAVDAALKKSKEGETNQKILKDNNLKDKEVKKLKRDARTHGGGKKRKLSKNTTEKYSLKYKKKRTSVEIKVTYGNDPRKDNIDDTIDLTIASNNNTSKESSNVIQTSENTIDLTIGSNSKIPRVTKKKKKSKRNIPTDRLKLKIRFKSESIKKKVGKKNEKLKVKTADTGALKQTVLQFSPDMTSPKDMIVTPEVKVTPIKRKYSTKQEKSSDTYKQMSIQSFFKVK